MSSTLTWRFLDRFHGTSQAKIRGLQPDKRCEAPGRDPNQSGLREARAATVKGPALEGWPNQDVSRAKHVVRLPLFG